MKDTCKDGSSPLAAAGYSNYYGITTIRQGAEKIVTNNSLNGGWLMLSGVEMGNKKNGAAKIEVVASAKTDTKLEVWLNDLTTGKLIAIVSVNATGGKNNWKVFRKAIKNVSGHHDVFVKFPEGTEYNLFIKTIRFVK